MKLVEINRGNAWLTEKLRLLLRTMESHSVTVRRKVPWSDLHFSKITPSVVIRVRMISTLLSINSSDNLTSIF